MSTSQASLLDLIDRPRSKVGQLSSQRAERQLRSSGGMGRQSKLAFEMIKLNPGMSTKELGAIGPLDRYQIARRCSELLESNLVRREQDGDKDFRWWAILPGVKN